MSGHHQSTAKEGLNGTKGVVGGFEGYEEASTEKGDMP